MVGDFINYLFIISCQCHLVLPDCWLKGGLCVCGLPLIACFAGVSSGLAYMLAVTELFWRFLFIICIGGPSSFNLYTFTLPSCSIPVSDYTISTIGSTVNLDISFAVTISNIQPNVMYQCSFTADMSISHTWAQPGGWQIWAEAAQPGGPAQDYIQLNAFSVRGVGSPGSSSLSLVTTQTIQSPNGVTEVVKILCGAISGCALPTDAPTLVSISGEEAKNAVLSLQQSI